MQDSKPNTLQTELFWPCCEHRLAGLVLRRPPPERQTWVRSLFHQARVLCAQYSTQTMETMLELYKILLCIICVHLCNTQTTVVMLCFSLCVMYTTIVMSQAVEELYKIMLCVVCVHYTEFRSCVVMSQAVEGLCVQYTVSSSCVVLPQAVQDHALCGLCAIHRVQ